jgi:membrane protease YdiL (CAAX protease family)
MLAIARYAIGNFRATIRRLTVERDPVLLLGRERRWRWFWVVPGIALTAVLTLASSLGVVAFESLAQRRNWITGGFPQSVFPIDPAQPITFLDLLLASLPFLLVPLIVLPVVHGVSWRRAFSYRIGFQWRQFWKAALALLLVAVLALAVSYYMEPQQFQFPTLRPIYAFWVVLTLGVVFVQSLGEEVLFRGYLVRVLGAVVPFRLPATVAVIALFVAGHLGNEDLQRDAAMNLIYFVLVEVVAYTMLFRTQNLAASAGLHWMNNVVALLAPTVPGQPTVMAAVIYTDPVYAAGGSRLLDPITHAGMLGGLALLLLLLLWRWSPFHLAKAPPPAVEVPEPQRGEPPTVS